MPIKFNICPANELILTWFEGLISNSDVVAAYTAVYDHPACRPGFRELTDLRNVSALDTDIEGIRAVSTLSASFHGPTTTRTAVVVGNEIDRIISALYGDIAELSAVEHVRQFKDMPNALKWLGIPAFRLDSIDPAAWNRI